MACLNFEYLGKNSLNLGHTNGLIKCQHCYQLDCILLFQNYELKIFPLYLYLL